jgi:hypothetical protein
MLSALAVRPDPLEMPLLEVRGRTLAARQLEGIRAAEQAVASASVVVGHAAEAACLTPHARTAA